MAAAGFLPRPLHAFDDLAASDTLELLGRAPDPDRVARLSRTQITAAWRRANRRRLKLKVNQEKSSIRHAADAALLGFGFYFEGPQVKIRVDPKAVKRLKDRLRELTARNRGVSMTDRIDAINRYITGWMGYFRLADTIRVFRSLDGWLRRHLRQIRWKEWKTTAAKRHNLRIRGISERTAHRWVGGSKGYWRVAGSQVLQVALPNTYWNRLGLKTLTGTWQRLNPTA